MFHLSPAISSVLSWEYHHTRIVLAANACFSRSRRDYWGRSGHWVPERHPQHRYTEHCRRECRWHSESPQLPQFGCSGSPGRSFGMLWRPRWTRYPDSTLPEDRLGYSRITILATGGARYPSGPPRSSEMEFITIHYSEKRPPDHLRWIFLTQQQTQASLFRLQREPATSSQVDQKWKMSCGRKEFRVLHTFYTY
jgi:hypothetical protein